MIIKVQFADNTEAHIASIELSDTYARLLEGLPSIATMKYYLPEIEERRDLIDAGKLKGFYCFQPILMDESEYLGQEVNGLLGPHAKCLKDYKVSATLHISDSVGQYQITLEFYLSSRELTEKSLPTWIQLHAEKLKFCKLVKYCRLTLWEELA